MVNIRALRTPGYGYRPDSPSAHVLHVDRFRLTGLDEALDVEVHNLRYGYTASASFGLVFDRDVLDPLEVCCEAHKSFEGPAELTRHNFA